MTQAQLDYIASLLLVVAESIKPSDSREFALSNLRNFHKWHIRHRPWQKYRGKRK